MTLPIEAFLLALLLVIAVVIARVRDLFEAAILFGVFSLTSAGLFTVIDAVDVAFTEAAIGAGVSTILFLGTLALTDTNESQPPRRTRLGLLAVLVTGAALVYGTFDMPGYGDPAAPIHRHVAPEYLADTVPHQVPGQAETAPQAIGIPNIVTSILASYRGYDTYAELTVILTAGVGVMLLLGRRRNRKPETQ